MGNEDVALSISRRWIIRQGDSHYLASRGDDLALSEHPIDAVRFNDLREARDYANRLARKWRHVSVRRITVRTYRQSVVCWDAWPRDVAL